MDRPARDRLTGLLLDAQRGDADALERFVVATQHDVMAVCRYLGDVDSADDLAQETYRRAISSLHRYRGEGPALHWLLTIARRTCADATRRRIRRRRVEQTVDVERSPIRHDVAPDHAHDVTELIDRLDPDRRAAFVLTQVNGLRYADAADVLGIPVGTVRSRVARARDDLVAWLDHADAAAPAGGADEHERGIAVGEEREPRRARRRPRR